MDLKEAIYTRRAVREFTAEPVDERTIRQIIDAAIQAPSAVNQQPWSFCVVRDKSVLDRISNDAKAPMLRTSQAALSHHFQALLSDPNFHIFYHAPALILISSVAESPWRVEDCSLAAENLMLAAHPRDAKSSCFDHRPSHRPFDRRARPLRDRHGSGDVSRA
jgi:nitroreductase